MKKIAIGDLKELSKKYKLSHTIVFAYDGELSYIATYGETVEQCSQAADFGNKLKDALGWPESLHAQPSRVKKLQKKIDELEEQLKSHQLNLIKAMGGHDNGREKEQR